ncbi:MAG: S8 family serine peptidase [Anaerolineales bacterium]|nr:S8 family serine peptidase [Anaerolineales bacterium]
MRTQAFKYLMLTAALLTLVAVVSAAPSRDRSVDATFEEATAVQIGSGIVVEPKGVTGSAVYIVQLADAPLATYRGNIGGLQATSPRVTGANKLDPNSAASQAYMAYLGEKRAEAIEAAGAAIERPLTIAFEYKATLNGYAAEMTSAEAHAIAKLPGVVRVEREKIFELQTDAGPAWIGAPSIWDGSATGDAGTYGEGIIVGVIDTGIDPWNPSFAETGDDGYTHTNPFGAGTYVGVCDPNNTNPEPGVVAYDPTFPCNGKLIGVWGYTASDPSPRDGDGHGSHTASTAAGNFVNNSVVNSPTATYTANISGVAPHANIIMYDGCIDGGGCPGSSLTAARDQALLDGVDVINYSIGSAAPTGDPYNDLESEQWLALRDAGVFVATSAGNAGPGDATVGSPADIPWITSVGAASHNRAFLQTITVTDGVNDPLVLNGRAMANGYGPAPIVFAADYADPANGISEEDARLCADGVFPAGTFNGEIVICERGIYGRVAKGQTVADGGAGGYILAQPNEFGGGSGALNADPHVLPAIHIDYATYQQLITYLTAAGGSAQGTIGDAVLDTNDSHGDIMAAFSSRGENGTFADIIVPSVTGPGRDIWAAYHQGEAGDGDFTWNVISGTSMSSPHVAGTGALMKAAHPDWSPAQIQSALMMTSNTNVLNDDGVNQATPFAMGSGRVNVAAAAQAGLVLDVTTAEYEAANPADGGDPSSLNLASMGNGSCVESCSWTRTFLATKEETWTPSLDLPDGMTGSVTPGFIAILPGQTVDITVEVNVLGLPADEWAFGTLMLTPGGDTPAAHLPIAVRPVTGDLPGSIVINAARNAGSVPVNGLTAITISELTVDTIGLAKATTTDFELAQDPTNDIGAGGFYDDLSQVFWMPIDVPADSYSLVAEILSSESPDVDMAVGQDLDGDGPEASEEVCTSTSGSWTEFCEVAAPAEGTWWVLVLNWEESSNSPDAISLATAVVPTADAGNMSVEGPVSVPSLEPFDIRVFWDTPDAAAGDRYYGAISLGTSPENAGNLGTIPVYLNRIADDVTKSASSETALPGDTITYTLTVNPNVLPEDISYVITDTLPAGVTYVDGSAAASAGTVSVADGVVTWEGDMVSLSNLAASYTMTTSDTDASCDTGFGGYVDLQGFGINAQSGITGDTVGFTAFSSGNPIDFYGLGYQGMGFTDDGFAIFDFANYGGSPWEAQAIPDPNVPNNVIAAMWQDMEIFYDQANNHGVSLATAGAPDGVVIVEYDDIQFFGGSADTFDFEVVVWRTVDDSPGAYEIILAYDNLNGSLAGPLTVGVENVDGTAATSLVNNGSAEGVLHDGLMVCFDLNAPSTDPVTITYAVTVDEGTLGSDVVNTAVSTTSNVGSQEAAASARVEIGLRTYMPVIAKK